MELIIYNPQIPEMIKFNNEGLIKELTEKLGHYNNLTYTDVEIKTAKTDRATLNKFKEAIDKRRKEIKSNCMKPYTDFEIKVKQIIEMIDQPILAIDTQVKAYEQKVKTEKRESIIAFFNESIGDLMDLVPIEKVWIEKWLNAAETMKAIKNDITLVLTKVRNDLEVITGLQSEFELQIRETYLISLNLTAALQEKTRLEEQKAKQEAYNKSQAEIREQARIKAEEQATNEGERIEKIRVARELERAETIKSAMEYQRNNNKPIPAPAPEPVIEGEPSFNFLEVDPEPVIEVGLEVAPELTQVEFKAWVTSDLLEAFEGFLEAYEIKYERMI